MSRPAGKKVAVKKSAAKVSSLKKDINTGFTTRPYPSVEKEEALTARLLRSLDIWEHLPCGHAKTSDSWRLFLGRNGPRPKRLPVFAFVPPVE
ncbi:hypothetical protein [Desulfonatronum thiodismutans]|uniref:hypothetical protein n=1 Tax=Desulfonatronum thiodismutans TaxID=159290 RepID=UPI00126893FF|nr:hypothetical protein [Desulfonatronum thiodismutans]